MNTVPTNIVEKILKLTDRINNLQKTIDHAAFGTTIATGPDQAAWLAVTVETQAEYTEQVNDLKRDHGIYPYHDGTVEVYRPIKATLKPAVPASA
jgi:hypothetical protein